MPPNTPFAMARSALASRSRWSTRFAHAARALAVAAVVWAWILVVVAVAHGDRWWVLGLAASGATAFAALVFVVAGALIRTNEKR